MDITHSWPDDWHTNFYIKLFGWENGECDIMRESREKKNAWQRGVVAWNNIDATWSDALGSGEWRTYTTEIWHPAYTDCSGQIFTRSAIRDGTFDFETLFDLPVGCVWVPGWMETITANIYIGTKNDGLIQGNMARWKTSDSWTPNDKPNMRNQCNFYYDDDPADATSGWNHSEMPVRRNQSAGGMRYTRIYDGEDTGTPAADIVTPLKDNEDWILLQLGP